MQGLLAATLESWASIYANHAVLRTTIGFVHVGGLVFGGGCAISADRLALTSARREPAEREAFLKTLRSTHGAVLSGLVVVIISGLLLFAADSDTYWHSIFFWIKMGLFGLLLVNGILLLRAERAAERGDARAWTQLTAASIASITLWFLTTLLGAALPNIS